MLESFNSTQEMEAVIPKSEATDRVSSGCSDSYGACIAGPSGETQESDIIETPSPGKSTGDSSSEDDCRNLLSATGVTFRSPTDVTLATRPQKDTKTPYTKPMVVDTQKTQTSSKYLKQSIFKAISSKVPESIKQISTTLFGKEEEKVHKRSSGLWKDVVTREVLHRPKPDGPLKKPLLSAKRNRWSSQPSSSICYDDVELTEDQRLELRKAFLMFEKGGKNKMAARDLGSLLRCLGWNPSERELEEARHELVVSARGSVSFAEVERYVARRGGICNGCRDEEDIQEAFMALDQCGKGKISVGKFRHFMTTLGEKMTEDEVEEMLQSLNKDKHELDYLEYTDLIAGLENTKIDS